MDIREDLTLGIDLGIGSCGWAVIRQNEQSGQILGWGIRTFDVPETDKKRTPTNQLRRGHRSARKVLRRRRQRMDAVRKLFKEAGLLDGNGKSALWVKRGDQLLNPWTLRAEALERKLSGPEFAVALGHIAKHRGFKSNSKRQSNDPASDDAKMLKEIERTTERLKSYRTIGEMFAKDEEFKRRKRNRDGDYSRSIKRDDQEKEVRILFARQRAAGNKHATEELEKKFVDIAFFQRPLADSEDKVGWCPFEPDERRAAKHSPSFEKFRFLSRLTALRIGDVALTAEEIARASTDFGTQNGMTFKRLRKILDLESRVRFEGVAKEDESKRDVVNRSSGNGCMKGTKALRDALGEAAWNSFRNAPEKLDRIAFVLTFREDKASIRKGLAEIVLEPLIVEALMHGVDRGDFSDFRGAGHVSAKVCRAAMPNLMRGLTYDRAMKEAGYEHAAPHGPERGDNLRDTLKKQIAWASERILNPVARKSLIEALKQVAAIVTEYGLTGHIHVELARDVGKSKEERDQIRRGIDERNKAKDKLRAEFRDQIGSEAREGSDDLLRYELWKEQLGRCLYCDGAIHPDQVVSSDNAVQVDHILPWGRSGDDSFVNKTLCHAGCNQEKKGDTPFEWFGTDEARWTRFTACIEGMKEMKGRKKRNYLLKDAKRLEETFRPRNLNDTRYATSLLLDTLARWYPDDVRVLARNAQEANKATQHWYEGDTIPRAKVRVASRPGPLTDRLRRAWGIQDLKKTLEPDGEKRKADDRHHALDALIVAATNQAALARLTLAVQEERRRGGHREFSRMNPPWPAFIDEVREKFPKLFVSRAERRRARGEAHAATIRQIVERDGEMVVFERRSVDALTEKDLARIKDASRNAKLVESIRAWIAAGKPKGTWPKSPKGDDVKKVSLRTNNKPDVLIREGAADRGEMVRVDVFRKCNRKGKWEFYLVPVYPHQVANAKEWPDPPNRAIQAYADETAWPEMGNSFEFCWSVYPLSFIELTKSDGEIIEGYSRNSSRSTGAFTVSPHHSLLESRPGIGARTLSGFRKFSIDRLGRKFPIERETRTWRGAVCT